MAKESIIPELTVWKHMKKGNGDSEDGVLHIFDINEMEVGINSL